MKKIVEAFSTAQKKLAAYARYGRFHLIWVIVRYALLFGIAYLMILPLFQMTTKSLTLWTEVKEGTTVYLPKTVTFENFREAIKAFDFLGSLRYTALFTIIATAAQLLSTSLAGYGLARYHFRGSGLLFGCVIVSIILPIQTAQIPLYLEYQHFDFFGLGKLIGLLTGQPFTVKLLNTMWIYFLPALLGVGLWSGLYIFLFRQMFRSIPVALEEAARVDGCGRWGTLFRIMLPNAVPVYITVALLSMINYWNDVVVGAMFNAQAKPQPIMVKLQQSMIIAFAGADEAKGAVQGCAVYLMIVLPLLLVFILGQKFFVESMDRSGVKG